MTVNGRYTGIVKVYTLGLKEVDTFILDMDEVPQLLSSFTLFRTRIFSIYKQTTILSRSRYIRKILYVIGLPSFKKFKE